MELIEGIYARQSVARVKPDPLPRETIQALLQAAVQAPNHHRNRPWRFTVVSGAARERLGAIMAQSLAQRSPEAPDSALEKERSRPLRAPVIIAVGIARPDGEKIVEMDNILAGAAAVENLLLAAHALGLGAIWRTGKAVDDPAVKAFLRLEPDQHLIALVYVGYPEILPAAIERPSYADYTFWIEE
jgi:nitroreductase